MLDDDLFRREFRGCSGGVNIFAIQVRGWPDGYSTVGFEATLPDGRTVRRRFLSEIADEVRRLPPARPRRAFRSLAEALNMGARINYPEEK